MPQFDVELHTNETTIAGGIPAPMIRFGSGVDRVQIGDSFEYVCTITLEAPTARDTLEMAFEAGNGSGAGDVPGSRTYDKYAKRSLSVGDVVVVHIPDALPLVAWVASSGWRDIEDISLYNLTIGEPSRA